LTVVAPASCEREAAALRELLEAEVGAVVALGASGDADGARFDLVTLDDRELADLARDMGADGLQG
jgi:hypothetical protein